MKVKVWILITILCFVVSSEEINLLLTKPESEDGDYSPNFRPGKLCLIEPAHEIMVLFFLRKFSLQTCMHSYLVGLDV